MGNKIGIILIAFCVAATAHAKDNFEVAPSAYTFKPIYDDIYVPYNGADKTVNLNTQHLVAGVIACQTPYILEHGSGSRFTMIRTSSPAAYYGWDLDPTTGDLYWHIGANDEYEFDSNSFTALNGNDIRAYDAGGTDYIRMYHDGTSANIASNTGDISLLAPGTTDINLRLGDTAGTNVISIQDSGNNEVASIDSDGNILTIGQHVIAATATGEFKALDMQGNIDMNFNDITQIDEATMNTLNTAYIASTITGLGIDMTGDPWLFSGVDYWFDGDVRIGYDAEGTLECGPLYSDHQHPEYSPDDHQHGEYLPWSEYANGYGLHSHPVYVTQAIYAQQFGTHGPHYGINTAHPEYVPYIGANKDVELGSQHIVAAVGQFTGSGCSSFQHLFATTIGATTIDGYLISKRFADEYGVHAHSGYYAAFDHQHGIYTAAHAVATTSATGFMPILSNVATEYLDGTGNWSTPVGSGSGGGVPYSVYGIHTHDNYYAAHPEYVPYSVYGIHTHDNYLPVSTYATDYGTHTHPTYQVAYDLATTNTHAVTTATADGFCPALSNVITQFLDGTGNWSIPAGGGGGGTIISSVPFQTLAAPQALQGIEQLRYQGQSYQNYGEIIVDGLSDETGIRTPSGMTYTGDPSYYYSAPANYISTYPPAFTSDYIKATSTVGGYTAEDSCDTANSLTGGDAGNQWLSGVGGNVNQRFHIDLGSALIVTRIYYENSHASGAQTTFGMKTFVFQGSNDPADFADLTYANDGNWVELSKSQATFDEHVSADQADPKYITVTNDTAYRYYAIKVADNWSGATYMGVRRIELQVSSSAYGSIHTQVFPMTITPTHMGVVLKFDSAFPSFQHNYVRVEVSRDGVSYADCHPITQIGTAGYYRAEMEAVTGTGNTGTAKISLGGTNNLEGYGIYAQ